MIGDDSLYVGRNLGRQAAAKGSRKLIGVVTDRDLCIGVIAERPRIAGKEGLDSTECPVEHCMTSKVVYCSADDNVERVLELMRENQVRRILVVDNQNTIQGVVSLSDLMNRGKVAGGDTRETLEGISKPTGEASKPRAQSMKVAAK